jgi:hypothetical protein
VRRVSATLFLLFYTASVLALTVQKTEAWAAELAHTFKDHPVSQHSGIGEARNHPLHQINGKLFEDHSVLSSAFVRSFVPPYSEAPIHQLEGFVSGENGRTTVPRAPPSLL